MLLTKGRAASMRWIATAMAVGGLVFTFLPRTAGAEPTRHLGSRAHETGAVSHLWSTQLRWTNPATNADWTPSDFSALRQQGNRGVILMASWNAIEPTNGSFDFSTLDTYMQDARAAGLQVVISFNDSVQFGNPASWITHFDVTDTGQSTDMPTWWDMQEQRAYFTYVEKTVAHVDGDPAFGGSVLNYGWLDGMWGEWPSGLNGYAPQDVAEFHDVWLPEHYKTIKLFDRRYGTSYTSWDQVPAAAQGQSLFPIYQDFRLWSVAETFGRLTADIRKETKAPLYYYWGGNFYDGLPGGSLPEIFFGLAKRYHVVVILDDNDQTGLAIAFGSLARAYGVPLLMEWTAGLEYSTPELETEMTASLVNYGLGEPNSGGMDFFDDNTGAPHYQVGYPRFISWLPVMKNLSGFYPIQPVAVYESFAYDWGAPSAEPPSSIELARLWSKYHVAFTFVTNVEVRRHLVNLHRFEAVLPLNGVDTALQQYKASGGHVLSNPGQLKSYASPYVALTPAIDGGALGGEIEVVPTVAPARDNATVVFGNISPFFDYAGSATLDDAALGLRPGPYYLVDAMTGAVLPSVQRLGRLCGSLTLPYGGITAWKIVPGSPPAGTPVPVACVSPPPNGATTVSAMAGGPPGGAGGQSGLAFLDVGAPAGGYGSDAALSLTSVGGQSGVETNEASGQTAAFVNLQIDPSSQVERARSVKVDVTYLASVGQGFQVQYNGARNAYQPGPTIKSPGTDQWLTVSFTLPSTHFDEGQAQLDWFGYSDLRLVALNISKPLLIHQVTITSVESS